MRVGVPAETKSDEGRVALTPVGTRELTKAGHEVIVQAGAGSGSKITDGEFRAQGARIVSEAQRVFEEAELIVKVKEPRAEEIAMLRPDHVLFGYLHLAPDAEQAQGLMTAGAACLAYETVEDDSGSRPLLAPMSAIAGRIAAQAGAFMLQGPRGPGLLMGGVPGVRRAQVVVIGGGVVGSNAASVAMGMLADVTVLDTSLTRLQAIDSVSRGRVRTVFSSALALEQELAKADLVIGAVLLPGARTPKIVTRDMLRPLATNGAVLVDVAIDQGGCCETSRPTTHSDPTFTLDGVLHYCVANMPGAVATTSTWALTNATLPYVLKLAELGLREALRHDKGLLAGLNVAGGQITHPAVADALQTACLTADEALSSRR